MTNDNKELRMKSLQTIIDEQVTIRLLGKAKPEDSKKAVIYIPLPEYGIALWHYLEND